MYMICWESVCIGWSYENEMTTHLLSIATLGKPKSSMLIDGFYVACETTWKFKPSISLNLHQHQVSKKKQLFLQSQINGNEHVTIFSPWKFNIAPENIPSQKEVVFQPSFFRGYVKLREGKTPLILDPAYIPGFPQSFSISRIKSSSSLHQETPRWLWNPLARFAPSPEKKMAAKNRFWGRTHKQPTGGCRLTWHLKIKPWKRRFRTLKPSSLGSGC